MLEQVLRQLFIKSFKTLYGQEPPVQQVNFQKTRPEFEGDMTWQVAIPSSWPTKWVPK